MDARMPVEGERRQPPVVGGSRLYCKRFSENDLSTLM